MSWQRDNVLRDSGQAMVESALVLPLVVFLIFGILQSSLMLQARLLAHYAAFKAVRAGSVNHADCTPMLHAAIASLMPAIHPFTAPGTPGTTPGEKLAEQFRRRMNNVYDPAADEGRSGNVVWLYRERPTAAAVAAMPATEDLDFDLPGRPLGTDPSRLEIRLVFWYPLRIPFANWVLSRMYLADLGLRDYTAQDPLGPVHRANWTAGASGYALAGDVAGELASRVNAGEYVFPIEASYTMRMMTPVKKSRFLTQNCPPLP